jgi:chromosome partitioning protein
MTGNNQAAVISIINFKGGVGKTTTSVNVAANLAHYHNRRVLLIDLDPQASSTTLLLRGERYYREIFPRKKSLPYMIHDLYRNRRLTSRRWIQKGFLTDAEGKGLIPTLEMIPGDPRTTTLERFFQRRHYVLKNLVLSIRSEYDFIVFDCPPTMMPLTLNVLAATDYYIIPTIPDPLSTMGIRLLISRIHSGLSDLTQFQSKYPELLGIVFTKVSPVSEVHKRYIDSVTEEFEAGGYRQFGIGSGKGEAGSIFTQKIRESADVLKAFESSLPLCAHNGESRVCGDYRNLTDEILRRIESKKPT